MTRSVESPKYQDKATTTKLSIRGLLKPRAREHHFCVKSIPLRSRFGGGWLSPANNNILLGEYKIQQHNNNNNNNNNNYYTMGPVRFNSARAPFGEGFFPP